MIRRLAAILALAAGLASAASGAGAAQLLMVETESCAWCLKWHREVGRAYPHTDEGRILPLVRVGLGRPEAAAALAGLPPVRYTPTFIVLACGREEGRIAGYPGEEAFYGQLNAILASLREKRLLERC